MDGQPTYPTRRPLRLRGYDYATPGMYFVTVCTVGRQRVFGDVCEGGMRLSPAGTMVRDVWQGLPSFSSGMDSDAFIVMPDHVHGIVVLTERDDECSPRASLPAVLHRFKSYTASQYRLGLRAGSWPALRDGLWQRSYFERVIRNERELAAARQYITENVAKWESVHRK